MIEQLSYLIFEVSDLAGWEAFATQVLGLVVVERAPEGLALRLDGHAQRIQLVAGPADDLAVMGWEVRDADALGDAAVRLRAAGVEVSTGTPGQLASRKVQGLIRFEDPSGIPVEIVHGASLADTPFASPVVRSGFVADALGLGHLVISARDPAASQRFYGEVLGFRLSDHIISEYHGHSINIAFYHVNPRHHSLAFGAAQAKRIHHFLLEARAMDEVGLAFDRTLAGGHRIMQTLGRHPNDRMFSFYAFTPSGFQFEFGFGGREIDDRTWQPATYNRISEWGHHPPAFLKPRGSKP